MQLGLVISVFLHAAILGWSLVSFQSQRQLRTPEPEPVAVGMIAPSEVTKVKLGSRTAKQPEAEAKESPKGDVAKKEAPKAKVAAAAPPPPPPPEKAPDPIAQKLAEPPPPAPATPPPPTPAEAQKKLEAEKLKADEQRKIEEQKQAEEAALRAAEEKKRAEEQKRAEEKKHAEEQRRQAELKKKREEEKKRREAALKKKREEEKKRQEAEAAKKKQFNADKIAALLNKVPDAAPPPPSAPPDQPTKAKGPALGAADGRDKQISASEMAMLKAQISSRLKGCWRLPSGGGGSDTPAVTLRWRLKPDGSLDGEPQVEQPRSDPLFRLAAEAAMRAVRECSPFDLPPERYNTWRVITWDFDPSQML